MSSMKVIGGKVQDIGYDYIELGLAPLNIEDQKSLELAKRQVAKSPLPTLVFNNFYPRDMRIVDSGVDVARLKSYLGRAAEFLQAAGAEVIVMGSAWSRNVPEGGDRARAEEQILQTLPGQPTRSRGRESLWPSNRRTTKSAISFGS